MPTLGRVKSNAPGTRFLRLLAAHGQAVNADRRCSDRATKFQVVGDLRNIDEQLLQIPRDRDLLDRVGKFATRDPKARCAARVVSSDEIHALAEELGDVKSFPDAANQFRWGLRSGLQKVITGTDAGCPRQPTRSVACSLQTKFFGSVGIQ